MEQRKRLSLESSEAQTLQGQAMTGTPWEVPVPKKVTFSLPIFVLSNAEVNEQDDQAQPSR